MSLSFPFLFFLVFGVSLGILFSIENSISGIYPTMGSANTGQAANSVPPRSELQVPALSSWLSAPLDTELVWGSVFITALRKKNLNSTAYTSGVPTIVWPHCVVV